MTAASLEDVLELQREGCERAGSPLYGAMLAAMIGDVRTGGVCAEVLAPATTARFGDAAVLRVLAALHRAVLAGEEPDLARHLPSVGGTPGRDLAEVTVAAVDRHREEIARSWEGGVQTNEPGRSAVLLSGLLAVAGQVGLPLRLLEVGASAGLNLQVDRYRFEQGGEAVGPADSPLVFQNPWAGDPPPLGTPLVVADRRGCDRAPIDPADPVGRRRLRSFVWADHLDRMRRLDAALEVAVANPVPVDREDAVPWAARQLAAPTPGCCTVLFHSIVFQYLGPETGAGLVAEIEWAAARATASAPLAWLRMEPGGGQAELRLTLWPGGSSRRLATSSYHGPPVRWSDPLARTGRFRGG